MARERGRKTFQVRDIRRSYRIRGRVARIQINQNEIIEVANKVSGVKVIKFRAGLNRIIEENRLRKRMLVYSAIKIKAKFPDLYSVLNPDTSSLSPSAKSKGARFVSARHVINQMKEIGKKSIKMKGAPLDKIRAILKDFRISKNESKVRAILTSYEIVWATPRRAPNSAYLELEAQPLPRVV